MKYLICTLLLVTGLSTTHAQRYLTRNGHISFFSETPLENIEAHNRQVASVLDIANGDLVFKVLIKSFQFEKALMQEHFNEKYLESDTYPKSEFKGKIENWDEIDLSHYDSYNSIPVKVTGELTMHGVTREVSVPGEVRVENGKISASSTFMVKLEDYKIKVPSVTRSKIAEEIEGKS